MRAVLIAVLVLVPAVASADPDRVGFAADVSMGWAMASGSVGHDGGHSHASLGLEYRRVALLAQGELIQLDTADDKLDAGWLYSTGVGPALRVQLSRHPGRYVHAEVGYTWRSMRGDGEVSRGCSVFGPCDAGFYMERPQYRDSAPYVTLAIGGRTRGSHWVGAGAEAGFTLVTIDRSGTAPDSRGAMFWVALTGAFGNY